MVGERETGQDKHARGRLDADEHDDTEYHGSGDVDEEEFRGRGKNE